MKMPNAGQGVERVLVGLRQRHPKRGHEGLRD